jgi:hypothetical protein
MAAYVRGMADAAATARFLDGQVSALRAVRREVSRRTVSEPAAGALMDRVVEELGRAERDMDAASGVLKSWMAEAEMAFVSSDLEAARGAAEGVL